MNVEPLLPPGYNFRPIAKKSLNNANNARNYSHYPERICYKPINFKTNFNNKNFLTPERKKLLLDFEKKYNLNFNDISLLNRAFMYNSNVTEHIPGFETYEKLEFFGDDVIELCVDKIISQSFPKYSQRNLTKLKQKIVCNYNLMLFSKKIGLEKLAYCINPSPGRMADMFEALLGAIFLDDSKNGFKNAYDFLNNNYKDEILSLVASDNGESMNYVDNLEDFVKRLKRDPKDLTFKLESKDELVKKFYATLYYKDKFLAASKSTTPYYAKGKAAKQAINVLATNPYF